MTVCLRQNLMSLPDVDVGQLSARLLLIRAHLDERAWRLLLGAEAKVLGRGGIEVVAAAVRAHLDNSPPPVIRC